MKLSLFYNPFTYVAGGKSLITGLVIILITSWLGSLNNLHFDGLFDVHFGASKPLWFFAMEVVADWFVFSLVLYISARILSASKVRAVDIFGTQALARFPMLFIAILCFIPYFQFTFNGIPQIDLRLLLFIIVTMFFTIWMVALMYNAYSISANLKGPKAIVSFIVSIILSEIIVKILLFKIF